MQNPQNALAGTFANCITPALSAAKRRRTAARYKYRVIMKKCDQSMAGKSLYCAEFEQY
jgi:hypothetical protein